MHHKRLSGPRDREVREKGGGTVTCKAVRIESNSSTIYVT